MAKITPGHGTGELSQKPKLREGVKVIAYVI